MYTVVTPNLVFNGFGVMCAASKWKLLLFNLKHLWECQEFDCAQASGSLQPACDLTGPVASPVPRRACKLSYPERVQVRSSESKCVCVRVCRRRRRREGQMRCLYNELTSFVLLIIICHLWEHNKGYNHGYSERARRKRRMKAKPHFALNPFHLLQKIVEK